MLIAVFSLTSQPAMPSSEKILHSGTIENDLRLKLLKVVEGSEGWDEGPRQITVDVEDSIVKTLRMPPPTVGIIVQRTDRKLVVERQAQIKEEEWRTTPAKGHVTFELKSPELAKTHLKIYQVGPDGQYHFWKAAMVLD